MRKLASLFLVLAIATACSATPKSDDLSAQAGTKQAQHDFAEGHPKIYRTGGIVMYEPGIPDNQRALVAKLPRDSSLSGCTNPKAPHATPFATAYNSEIVHLMSSAH